MEAVFMPVVILGITGILMGFFLAYASKKFEVQRDPKVEAILGILPGVNCGACGYPGCSGYASGVVESGAKMTLCAPGGPKVAKAIGDIMGVEVEVPVKKKPAKPAAKKEVKVEAPKVTSGEPISAPKEFIEKNKKMLTSYKEAFDAGDTAKLEKNENLAKMAKKDELLKYYEEIKAGKIIPDLSGATATATPKVENFISAPKEFIEKNKKMLTSYKEAFDAGDTEKLEKNENLAKMAKKDELLKYYEEIKAGKSVPDPATMGDAKPVASNTAANDSAKEKQAADYCSVLGDGLCVPELNQEISKAAGINTISASKEFIEKNKKMLNSYKEAFDAGDTAKLEKNENLAKMAKKDELLKYFEEIKAGKLVPDPATMVSEAKAETLKVIDEIKTEITEKDKEKQEADYCSVLGDGLCVPEQNEQTKEELKNVDKEMN